MVHSQTRALTLVGSLFFVACGGASTAEPAAAGGGSGGTCAHHGEGAGCTCEHHGEAGCGCEHHGEAGGACAHHGEGGDGCGCEGHGEAGTFPELEALHAELGPVFHQEAGATRAAAACEHASALASGAASVQGATAPAGADAAAWSTLTANLVAAAGALRTECDASGPAAEERLIAFHDAFHALMEAAGGHAHGEHGEHEHH